MDELYIIARRVLLDALAALGSHRNATIVVGAQAVYLHTGDADLAVAEYTTDADLVLDPDLLGEIPPLEQALANAGFLHQGSRGVGVWKTSRQGADARSVEVQVDLLVPSAVSPGKGRRAARLPEPEIYRTWFFSKIFEGFRRPSKRKRQKCKPKRARPRLGRIERERQFRELLDEHPQITRAEIAQRVGVSRAWVTKVLGT